MKRVGRSKRFLVDGEVAIQPINNGCIDFSSANINLQNVDAVFLEQKWELGIMTYVQKVIHMTHADIWICLILYVAIQDPYISTYIHIYDPDYNKYWHICTYRFFPCVRVGWGVSGGHLMLMKRCRSWIHPNASRLRFYSRNNVSLAWEIKSSLICAFLYITATVLHTRLSTCDAPNAHLVLLDQWLYLPRAISIANEMLSFSVWSHNHTITAA